RSGPRRPSECTSSPALGVPRPFDALTFLHGVVAYHWHCLTRQGDLRSPRQSLVKVSIELHGHGHDLRDAQNDHAAIPNTPLHVGYVERALRRDSFGFTPQFRRQRKRVFRPVNPHRAVERDVGETVIDDGTVEAGRRERDDWEPLALEDIGVHLAIAEAVASL